MLCDKCKKNIANVHYTTVINGVTHEEHLCSECAERSNFKPFSIFARDWFGDMDSMFDFGDYLPCVCGTSLSDIVSTGRVGCSDCDEHYKDIISQAVASVNKGAKKKIEENKNLSEKDKKILDLRKQISEAVDREDYEKAGELKKQIDALSKEDK